MMEKITLMCACLAFAGCVGFQVERLPQETPYRSVQSATAFCGLYRNKASHGEEKPCSLLSDILFPETQFIKAPGTIRIRKSAPSRLTCEALADGKVVSHRELVEGRDFHLINGNLRMESKALEPVASLAGAGIGRETIGMRLTQQQDLVVNYRSGGAGLMLFIVPMLVTKVQDSHFERIGE